MSGHGRLVARPSLRISGTMTNAALSQITTRVVKLETESATATGFTIDLDERQYLVTSNLAAYVTEIVRKGAEG